MSFPTLSLLLLGLISVPVPAVAAPSEPTTSWRVGIAQAKITPQQPQWMGGFASRTQPAEGTLDDLYAKVMVLESPDGGLGVLLTADLVGIPKWLYENLSRELARRHGLARSQIRFAASHTHSGPVLKDALRDIYPLDDAQRRLIANYSAWLEPVLLDVITAAYTNRQPATLWTGEGRATIAVNRRTNDESKLLAVLARGEKPNGPSDFAVPVLAVRTPEGALRTVVFGYAAHTSCLIENQLWSADYCGVSMRAVEERHAGAMAMFWQGCGSDQSCAPRGTVALCRQRGQELAQAIQQTLDRPMRAVAPSFRAALELIPLDFGEQPTAKELETVAAGTDYRARWARRLLGELAAGQTFATRYPEYPVQVWKLGDQQLWIGLGGEVCVDYVLRFKREYGAETWVNGYANDVMAYIPSRRLWEEGGYQAGAFEVYGLPANRWCPDIEERIASTVARLVKSVSGDPDRRTP